MSCYTFLSHARRSVCVCVNLRQEEKRETEEERVEGKRRSKSFS